MIKDSNRLFLRITSNSVLIDHKVPSWLNNKFSSAILTLNTDMLACFIVCLPP